MGLLQWFITKEKQSFAILFVLVRRLYFIAALGTVFRNCGHTCPQVMTIGAVNEDCPVKKGTEKYYNSNPEQPVRVLGVAV